MGHTSKLGFQPLTHEAKLDLVEGSENIGRVDGFFARAQGELVGATAVLDRYGDIHRGTDAGGEGYAHLVARWLMKTVALLLSAKMALACICVLGGSTPFAKRVIMDLGRLRSCGERRSLVSTSVAWHRCQRWLGGGLPQLLTHPGPSPCLFFPATSGLRMEEAPMMKRPLLGARSLWWARVRARTRAR